MAVATNFKSGLNNMRQWVSCESDCRNGSLGNCGLTEPFGQHPAPPGGRHCQAKGAKYSQLEYAWEEQAKYSSAVLTLGQ